jgi:hypothetical protein
MKAPALFLALVLLALEASAQSDVRELSDGTVVVRSGAIKVPSQGTESHAATVHCPAGQIEVGIRKVRIGKNRTTASLSVRSGSRELEGNLPTGFQDRVAASVAVGFAQGCKAGAPSVSVILYQTGESGASMTSGGYEITADLSQGRYRVSALGPP